MIAIDLNGTIKTFSKLPKVWSDANGTHLNITDGEAFGFYPVITPELSAIEELGSIYFDSEANVFTYAINTINITETLSELKKQRIMILKESYNNLLSKTDWYITRYNELSIPIPQDISNQRAQLREECNSHEMAINNLNTKIAVIEYYF